MARTMQNTKDTTLLAYMDGLFGYAMVLTRNYASAADLVQETYLRALNVKERLPWPSEVKGWLFTTLRNIWLNQLSREIVELISEGNLETAAGDPMDRAAGAGTGVVPRLHGCFLGADADLACRRAARAHPAQGQARWSCLDGSLI